MGKLDDIKDKITDDVEGKYEEIKETVVTSHGKLRDWLGKNSKKIVVYGLIVLSLIALGTILAYCRA